jgi:hypothetical protein
MTHIKETLKKNSREIFPTTKKADKKITKPTFKPTAEERALVEQMCSVGIPQESICLVIRDGIDDKTLRRHFRIFFVVSYCLFYKLSSSTC